jgi:hypothetical protein
MADLPAFLPGYTETLGIFMFGFEIFCSDGLHALS